MPIDMNYVKKHTFPGGGYQKDSFFIELPSGYVERIPDATDLEDAHRRALERHEGRATELPDGVNRETKYLCPECEEICTDESPDKPEYRYFVVCSECGHTDTCFKECEYNKEAFLIMLGEADIALGQWAPENFESQLNMEDIILRAENMFCSAHALDGEVGEKLQETTGALLALLESVYQSNDSIAQAEGAKLAMKLLMEVSDVYHDHKELQFTE